MCTIGPASSSLSMLTRMMKAGMNVARLNFSHGTHQDHKNLIKHVRSAAKKAGRRVAVLQDLQGPKIRVGKLPEEGIVLKKHQKISFKTNIEEYVPGGPIPVTYKDLHKDVKKGQRILLDDGRFEVKVTAVRANSIFASVVVGGAITSNKGMNLPDSTVSASAFTKKDREDLLFGLEQGVDWVALSFVTSPDVVRRVRKLINARCRTLHCIPPKIIVKIERAQAVERFDEILKAADAIMVARGDLGIEIPFEQVPIFQKECIEKGRLSGKPVVVATHMLDSMTGSPRATRAEASDVANAVIDHADAVMLSGETATGEFPYEAVRAMARIIKETEKSRLDDISFFQVHDIPNIGVSMAQSLHVMAINNQVDLLATASTYSIVSDHINVFRPELPIVVACKNETAARQQMLRSGVHSVVMDDDPGTFIHRMERELRKMGYGKRHNKRVAYLSATPVKEIRLVIRGCC